MLKFISLKRRRAIDDLYKASKYSNSIKYLGFKGDKIIKAHVFLSLSLGFFICIRKNTESSSKIVETLQIASKKQLPE